MPSEFDQKEDLRIRMADLEKKLAESEEERCKLEKTCNVLMRAFREEEKMQYKALNKKYEKFLEDCAVRKRRNDIILRTLCRIEDRSRALFAKTERLKLLKDRYISYLKINEVKGNEVHSSVKTFPLSSPSRKISTDVTPKFLRWTTPLTAHYKPEESVGNSFSRTGNSDLALVTGESFRGENPEDRKIPEVNVTDGIKEPVRTSRSPSESNSVKSGSDYVVKQNERLADKRENGISNEELLMKNIAEVIALREKKVISHQESIEQLKKALSFEFDTGINVERHSPHDGKITDEEKKQIKENIEPQNRFVPFNAHLEEKYPKIKVMEIEEDPQTDQQEENIPSEMLPKNTKPLPMGLDGVDYQNETYPESYYEQPVHHHNNTSIASDVILEEDETEQDLDEEDSLQEPRPNGEDNSHGSTVWGLSLSPKHGASREPESTSETNREQDEGHPVNANADEVKTRESDSDNQQLSEEEKSEQAVSEKNKSKSKLIHLLESDSESFQIEHGDVVPGNDDTDFDFSFHQN